MNPFPERSGQENDLVGICESWADFTRRIRTGVGGRVDGHRAIIRGASLGEVASMFDVFRRRFESGEKAALMDALRFAADENVPMPYWVSDGLLGALASLETANVSLHDVFGFEDRYPLTEKSRRKAIQDRKLQSKLYFEVGRLMRDGMGKTEAIEAACQSLPIQPRKAWDLFSRIEARMEEAIAARSGRRLHKSK